MVVSAEWVAILLTCVAMIAGVAVWAVRLSTKPFGQIIEANTAAWHEIKTVISTHAQSLEDHEVRLTRQETIHEVRGCAEGARFDRQEN